MNAPQTSPWNGKWRNTTKLILWSQYYPNAKTGQGHTHTHTHTHKRSISLMNIDSKILHQIPGNRIQQHIEKITHYNQVVFFPGLQGWFNKCKSINVIQHINRINDNIKWSFQLMQKKLLTKFNTVLFLKFWRNKK
jgi:hypothetical protein